MVRTLLVAIVFAALHIINWLWSKLTRQSPTEGWDDWEDQ